MTSSLYTYRGMPLNKIIATNQDDNASGITKVNNPLESYFTEQTKYKLLTTTASMVKQNLTNVIYSVPSLSSLAGQNYSAYYKVYNYVETIPATTQTTYNIPLTDAIACFSKIIVFLIGGSGAGIQGTVPTTWSSTNTVYNGSSGGCVIYQIDLSKMGGNNTIQIIVGRNNPIADGGKAGDTVLNWVLNNGIQEMAKAGGGMSASTGGSGFNGSATAITSLDPYISPAVLNTGQRGNDTNQVYTINGYKQIITDDLLINNPSQYPIFYENPNFYGGTQGPYMETNPIPKPGYARVYYML